MRMYDSMNKKVKCLATIRWSRVKVDHDRSWTLRPCCLRLTPRGGEIVEERGMINYEGVTGGEKNICGKVETGDANGST